MSDKVSSQNSLRAVRSNQPIEAKTIGEKCKALVEEKEEKRNRISIYILERSKNRKNRENKISIAFNGKVQLYNIKDIRSVLFSCIIIFTETLNRKEESIPKDALNEL